MGGHSKDYEGIEGKAENYKKRSKNNKNYIVEHNLLGFPHAFQVICYPTYT